MMTPEEKAVAKQVNNKLDKLLTVIIAGGVGLQFDRESAILLHSLTSKINSGEVK